MNRVTIAVEDLDGDICYIECSTRPCKDNGKEVYDFWKDETYVQTTNCTVYEPTVRQDGIARQYHSEFSRFRVCE